MDKQAIKIAAFIEELQVRLKNFEAAETDTDLSRTGKVLSQIRAVLKELKQFTMTYQFENIHEEILFFKHQKPILLSQFYYYKRKFSIQLFDAFRDHKSRIENYQRVLGKMQLFVQRHKEFYEYCMSGSTYLDESYFTRRNMPLTNVNFDDHFTTSYDDRFSRILSMELIKAYIQECLRRLEEDDSTAAKSTLIWTAPKTDLVELIYALHEVGAFNNSTFDVRRIVETFEVMLNVNLGNYYRTFLGIRMRKSGQTAFLDQLKERLTQRINELENR